MLPIKDSVIGRHLLELKPHYEGTGCQRCPCSRLLPCASIVRRTVICASATGFETTALYTGCKAAQCGHVHGKSDFTLRLHARATNGEINNSGASLHHRICVFPPSILQIAPAFTFPVSRKYFYNETCRYLSRELRLEVRKSIER